VLQLAAMASALAIQLERLKAAATPSAPTVRGKPSLLFSYQDAADIDVDTIYHLGLAGKVCLHRRLSSPLPSLTAVRNAAGLQDLASRDSRFRVFESSLFSRDLLSQNREHHNKEWNAQVSAVISGFLQLLSNYFLQPSAFKTLEYLIRKFK
jgi:U3 small nucleolar RNA-associated protein 10